VVTIIEFLTARLDEDEAMALAAPGNQWVAYTEDSVAGASVYDEQWVLLYPMHYDHDEPLSNRPGATGPAYIERSRDGLARHVARHDPAHVLADIAAKRAIIAQREQVGLDIAMANADPRRQMNLPILVNVELVLDATIKHLASAYSDHPDYRDEWKP
jgi:hypothetical protein